ncbi:hypothetical protein N0V84_002561 [Fusarium piperis]|uniref:Uncharacterized protein n=1 Tax=Fusarium piperis TaxID=1435070 RepID=A0A9W9BRL7_9HYPO|nr:hypothetical protein N0V84_002561 [Fusarium piperis]
MPLINGQKMAWPSPEYLSSPCVSSMLLRQSHSRDPQEAAVSLRFQQKRRITHWEAREWRLGKRINISKSFQQDNKFKLPSAQDEL